MDGDNKWLCGLKYARSLNFTDAQYEEALKMIDSPDNANQLLVALIDVSSRGDTTTTTCCPINRGNQIGDVKTGFTSTNTNGSSTASRCWTQVTRESSASSSYYSGSFPSSSNQSFESLQQQPFAALRKIYIDGSNVARTHGKDATFSWNGIKLCVDWFLVRQHRVKVFVPADRCHQADPTILNYLNDRDAIVETPSGCNDDYYVIETARQNNGVIVSNDLYRDEKRFNSDFQSFIHTNRLPYVFVDDSFLPANDPQGRSGPSLHDFLRDLPDSNNYSKFHQRYQRGGGSVKHIKHNTFHHRTSLQSTRSHPMEQARTMINHNNNQTAIGLQYYHQQGNQDYRNQQQQHHHHHHQQQEIRMATSVAYNTNINSNTKDQSDIQPVEHRPMCRRPVLCRKKHLIN